ncbi:MAG: ectoine utilization protein EutA, partial [Pseudomonadota bacterium]
MVSVVRSPVAHRLEAPGLHRVGVVALSTDMTLEWDAARILPHDRMVLHVSRIAFENPTTPENLARMGP